VSRANGAAAVRHAGGATLALDHPGTGDDLRFFVGDDAGRIWVISNDGRHR
jgi:hypothetical protein